MTVLIIVYEFLKFYMNKSKFGEHRFFFAKNKNLVSKSTGFDLYPNFWKKFFTEFRILTKISNFSRTEFRIFGQITEVITQMTIFGRILGQNSIIKISQRRISFLTEICRKMLQKGCWHKNWKFGEMSNFFMKIRNFGQKFWTTSKPNIENVPKCLQIFAHKLQENVYSTVLLSLNPKIQIMYNHKYSFPRSLISLHCVSRLWSRFMVRNNNFLIFLLNFLGYKVTIFMFFRHRYNLTGCLWWRGPRNFGH